MSQGTLIGAGTNQLLGFTQTLTRVQGSSTLSTVVSTVSYSLDSAGNMTSDGLRTFEYDNANRLAKARIFKDGEAMSVSYLHNALGQRVFKGEAQADQYLPDETELGQDFIDWLRRRFRWLFESQQASTSIGTAYVYADAEGGLPEWAVLGSYDNGSASGTGRSEYIWLPVEGGGAIPVGLYRNGNLYAIHADHLGTPRLMTDGTNQVVWQWPYSAFGNNRPTGVLEATTNPYHATTIDPEMLKATPPAVSLDLRFPGQMVDGETGTFYNYHRSYLAGQGRYTQADPIGFLGGWNGFAYVDGNPLSFIDPEGLQAQVNLFGTGDPAYKPASRVPQGSANEVYGHGSPTGMWSGPIPGGKYMPAKALADILKKSPNFNPNLPTKLLGCNVGKGSYCQAVANALGGTVQCYDETVWYGTEPKLLFWSQGTVGSWAKTPGPDGKAVPNYSQPGNLVTFTPNRRGK